MTVKGEVPGGAPPTAGEPRHDGIAETAQGGGGGKRRRLGPVAGLIVLALFISGAYLYASSMGRQAKVGHEAPAFQLPALEEGQQIALADFPPGPIVINFFASWCEPCRDEMPALQAVWHESGMTQSEMPSTGGGIPAFHLLGINVGEPAFRAEAFTRELGVAFPVALDGNSYVKRLYNVRGLPETFFIDAEGVLRHVHRGPLDEQSFAYLLDLHLNPPPPDAAESGL